jgi:predicted PolB exonuclease-like 3'-5' exonuclease
MKRFFIVIPPVIFFAIFVVFYRAHERELDAKIEEKRLLDEKAKQEEDARKKALQDQSEKEAERQREEIRLRIEAQKEKEQNEKEEKYRKILAETEAANAQSKKLQAQIVKLQADILAVRAARDKAQAEAMETKLDLEKGKVDKRNAEFEIQRYTEMLANAMGQSQALLNDALAAKKK